MKKILFILLSVVLIVTANAQPGTLDKSFGTGGMVISETYTGVANAVVIQPDGKIIAAGSGEYETTGGFLAVRYLTNGSLDSSFGNNGRAVALSEFIGVSKGVTDCALQADGKILVAGGITSNDADNSYDIAIARFNNDGTIDRGFGNNGSIITNLNYRDVLRKISVLDDGKILATGYISEIRGENIAFAIQYDNDGSIDSSFGIKGLFRFPDSEAYFFVAGHAIDKSGNIFIGGKYDYGSVFVLKLKNNGFLDNNFGNNGEARYSNVLSALSNIAVLSDNKILLAGTTTDENAISSNFSVVRMNADGSADKSFGFNGLAVAKFGLDAAPTSLALQQNNDFIIGGYVSPDHFYKTYYPGLARFKANGLNDSTFGENGLTTTITENNTTLLGMALQEDGKIVTVGYAFISEDQYPEHFFIARYLGDPQEKYVHIKHWLHRHGITWDDCPQSICNNLKYYAVERSSNGSSFTEITRIFRRNNQQQYSYEDVSASTGTNYYRLRTVSTDGSVAYSNVVAIDGNETAVKVYPNPVTNTLHIEGLPEKTKLTIVDFSGNVKAIAIAAGNTYNWNIAQLKQGNYILKIEESNTVITRKFVKE